MIGQQIKKPLANYDAYSQAAEWANANNATIEDKGNYYEVVEVPAPTTEQQAQAIRAARDGRLKKADYAINIAEDAGLDTSALRQYRQALRDVPAQPGFPEKVSWPEAPEADKAQTTENKETEDATEAAA